MTMTHRCCVCGSDNCACVDHKATITELALAHLTLPELNDLIKEKEKEIKKAKKEADMKRQEKLLQIKKDLESIGYVFKHAGSKIYESGWCDDDEACVVCVFRSLAGLGGIEW